MYVSPAAFSAVKKIKAYKSYVQSQKTEVSLAYKSLSYEAIPFFFKLDLAFSGDLGTMNLPVNTSTTHGVAVSNI